MRKERISFEAVSAARWRAKVEAGLKGAPLESLQTQTPWGDRLSLLGRLPAGWVEAGGEPGRAPYLRGARAEISPWRILCRHARPEVAELRARLLRDLEGGAEAFTLELDPRRDPLALRGAREAGTFAALLEGLDLSRLPLSLEPGAAFVAEGEALLEAASAHLAGAAPAGLDLGADPLGQLAREGGLPTSAEEALEGLGALGVRAHRMSGPGAGARAARIDASLFAHAGAHEAEELALSLSIALAYLKALCAAGLGLDEAAAQLRFRYAASSQVFWTAAKLRAARLLFSRVARACGVGERASAASLEARSDPRELSRLDPWANILRATLAAFGAAIGGAEAIELIPFSAPLGIPEASARRLARNTQLLLREEAGLGRIADPAGGSAHLEELSASLARAAWARFQELEAQGGALAGLRAGAIQARLREQRQEREEALLEGRRLRVGVNLHPDPELPLPPLEEAPEAPPTEPISLVEKVDKLILKRDSEPFESISDRGSK